MWEMAFSGTPAWALQRAAVEWAASEKWFPALSEIRRKIDRLTGDALEFETWLEAWGKVETAMQRHRGYSAVHFTNWITEHLVTVMGGITKLAQADEIGQNANRAAFRDTYQQLVARAQQDQGLMQQCIAWQEQMRDRRREQERTILDRKTSTVERNPRYFGSERAREDEDMILTGLGYVLDAGKWRNPTPEEAKASGHWRAGNGGGNLEGILEHLRLQRDEEPF